MENTIDQRQQEIVDEFGAIDQWEDRYKKIIALGKVHASIPEKYKIDDNLVKGCQSKVWMFAEKDDRGKMILFADSDAMIVRGLVSLLVKVFNEREPKEVLNAEVTFIKDIGLGDHLTQSRANGLVAMIKQIKMYAMAYSL